MTFAMMARSFPIPVRGGHEARSCVDIGILHRIGYVPFQVDDNDDRISKCPDGGISCEVSRLEMGNNQGGL